MEVIIENSEQALLGMLPHLQKNPEDWMALHINVASLHTQTLNKGGLSKALLAQNRDISLKLAHNLFEHTLSAFSGKIMVFEDNDVLALFLKRSDSLREVLVKLRDEFTKSGMINLLVIEEIKDKLQQTIIFAEEKKRSAEDYQIKNLAVELGENLSEWAQPDPRLTESIQKKRDMRLSSTVLIIEDDILVRGLLATLLGDEHQILQAKNAQAGIITYIDQAPNIVFLDIHMPGLSGHETLKRLMQIDPKAYVIMLSADSSSSNVQSTQADGAAGFIRKPFTIKKLREYVGLCPSLNPGIIPPSSEE